MRIGVSLLGLCGVLGWVGAAAAEEVPPARTGFQFALRTGYSIPMGKTGVALPNVQTGSTGSGMSEVTTGQVPVIIDIGGKIIPQLFLGGYFGLAFGGEAGAAKAVCDYNGGACVSVSAYFGIEAQYHILPAGPVNPWLGYGAGFESLAVSEGNDSNNNLSLGGFQFARLMGGVDFRVNRTFGVGPFVDLALGRYSSASEGSRSVDINGGSGHQWLTLGARFVFFP